MQKVFIVRKTKTLISQMDGGKQCFILQKEIFIYIELVRSTNF